MIRVTELSVHNMGSPLRLTNHGLPECCRWKAILSLVSNEVLLVDWLVVQFGSMQYNKRSFGFTNMVAKIHIWITNKA